MSKDPAFLFYPNDYIGGTMGMTLEEKGAYIELLMMQFNRGHMTTHMIGQTIGHCWDTIQVKFIQDENGLWYNKRLEEEQKKRKQFTESRRNNISGTNQYTKKSKKESGHTVGRMEDVNEDIDIKKNRIEKNKILYEDESIKAEDEIYSKFVSFLFGNNDLERSLNECLALPKDLILHSKFQTLLSKYSKDLIIDKILAFEVHKDTPKKRSFMQNIDTWCKNELKH